MKRDIAFRNHLFRGATIGGNEVEITVAVAIRADHYGIKSREDVGNAKIEIPTRFEAGIISIAADASYLPDDQKLLGNPVTGQLGFIMELNGIIEGELC